MLSVVLSFCAVSCGGLSQQYSFEFEEETFASVLNEKVDKYDENWDFHLYKWGNEKPTGLQMTVKATGSMNKPVHTLISIEMILNREDSKFGLLKMGVSYHLGQGGYFNGEEIFDVSIYGYDFKIQTYSNESSSSIIYTGYYQTQVYRVVFTQQVDEDSMAYKNGYTVENFITYLPEILDSKYPLTL